MKSEMAYWDENTGIAKYVITTKDGTTIVGTAKCSPEDQDMKNEKTGCTIAEQRAKIAFLRHIRDTELKPELKGLKRFWNTMNHSKYYDANSYPIQRLLRTISQYERDIKDINLEIFAMKAELKTYLEFKGVFYKKIRKLRGKSTNQAKNN